MAYISKMADRRVKQCEIWESGTLVTHIWISHFTCRFKAINFGVIRCIILKMSCKSKMSGHRAKRTEIWDSGTLVNIWCTSYLVMFKVIWGSFGAPDSKWPIIRKRLVVDRNSEIWESGTLVKIYGVHLTLQGSRSFGGHSVRYSQNVC